MAKVTKLKIDYQNNSGGTVYATWSFGKKNVDHYNVYWYYATGDKNGKNTVWFRTEKSEVSAKQSTYSIPSNATAVKIAVAPVSKTYKTKKGATKKYWTGEYSYKVYYVSSNPPDKPSAPTVTIDKYELTATLDITNTSVNDRVEFYVVKGIVKHASTPKENNSKFPYVGIDTDANRASWSCPIDAGGIYRVRCRIHNVNDAGTIIASSEWSEYSTEVKTIPGAPSNVTCRANSKTSAFVTWTGGTGFESHEVEYTDKRDYFNSNPSAVSSVTSTSTSPPHAEITGLESGKRYFFRVRAVNAQGESAWVPNFENIISTVLGTKPEAPTTWALSTTVTIGANTTLYWTHNSEDGSNQTDAKIEIKVGDETSTITYSNSGVTPPTIEEGESDASIIYSIPLPTSSYKDGDEILWKVCTKGIADQYSDWSIQRKITVYAPPTLTIGLPSDVLTTLPYNITLTPGSTNQKPISYYIGIVADKSYATEDDMGRKAYVTKGTEVYSKIYNVSTKPLTVNLLPGNIDLQNGQTYIVKATVSTDSGLRAEASDSFTVNWSDETYEPDAAIAIDYDNLTAVITPFCHDPVESEDDEEVFTENVSLTVYRREYDGSFVEVGSVNNNNGLVTVIDDHPALDYARYRIVATNKTTGVMGYSDLPGEPVGEPSIVINWNEDWSIFDYSDDDIVDELEDPPFTASMVRLPYNVDVDESHDPDVSLVGYIGRNHPVTYYGTQKGVSANWSTEIPKDDKETLYALRRLAAYSGDVYVREPSGVGYWANVNVKISSKHKELTIPISFSIKRVEGGE